MDQNSLPPLPSVEELFAPSASRLSSLAFIKNVNLFIPVPPLPSLSNAGVPPVPPKSPSLEYTEPYSPVPPQPTSPLVDQFDYQLGGDKTSNSVFQLEQNKGSEIISGPPSKKARYSETAEAASSLQDDGREEGEISDDDDEAAVIPASRRHKPPSPDFTISHSSHRPQSSSHRQAQTNCSQNITKTLPSSSHRHHPRTSDTTGRHSHHRHRTHSSHPSSKDASKSDGHRSARRRQSSNEAAAAETAKHESRSSRHHRHSLQSDLPLNKSDTDDGSRSSDHHVLLTDKLETAKKNGSETVSQYRPSSLADDIRNRGLSSSTLRSSGLQHVPAGSTLVSEIVKNMSRSSVGQQKLSGSYVAKSSLQPSSIQHPVTDNAAAEQNSPRLNHESRSLDLRKAAPSDTTKDESQVTSNHHPSSHQSDSLRQIKTSCHQPQAMHKLAEVETTESRFCQQQVSESSGNNTVPQPPARTALATTRHSSTKSQIDLDAPYSPGSLDLDDLFEPTVAADIRVGASNDDNASGNADKASLPRLGLASNIASNSEITNMHVEDSVVEIDTEDLVDQLPAAEEVEMAAESAAVDGRGQEYEIIDDLDSNADETFDGAVASSENSEVELDNGEEESSPDKHVKPQRNQRIREAGKASEQTRNDLEPRGEDGDDDFQAPLVNIKTVLREKGLDPFDILPEGWLIVTHMSGMPVYLHKQLRVCTLSRPYFLGPGSARKHNIPVSAVPCLQYRRALEAESRRASEPQQSADAHDAEQSVKDQSNEVSSSGSDQKNTADGQSGGSGSANAAGVRAKVESVEDHKKLNCIVPLEFREYCKHLFEFKTITVRRFRRWKDRRKHNVQLKKASRPVLLPSTKLITCPLPAAKLAQNSKKKAFVLNPAGKSHICVLHEYAQHAMRIQPRYIFEELENAETPYSATVVVDDIKYGTGYASSKRAAKLEAARITLCILIPEMNRVLKEEDTIKLHDLSFFDDIRIEDLRVAELCIKAGQPTPYQVLCDCLKRNFGMGDTKIQMDSKSTKHQKSEFTMRVGKHEAKIRCKNKREGKQLAAQAVLQLMHPQLTTWGSLLRLYAKSSEVKEKKAEEHSVTELQTKSQPNKAILSKLREEMMKLYTKQDAMKMNVKGKLKFTGPNIQSTELGGVTL